MSVDVRSQESVDALVATAMTEFGHVDVMINNAGVLSPNGRMHNLSDADWSHAFEVNLMGAVHGVVAAVKVMRSLGGSIITTASVAGVTAWIHAAPYSATKAAVIAMTKVAAVEYAKDRIRVNCVCPGVFPSAMHSGLDDTVMATLAQRHPLGLGTPRGPVRGIHLFGFGRVSLDDRHRSGGRWRLLGSLNDLPIEAKKTSERLARVWTSWYNDSMSSGGSSHEDICIV